MASSLADETDLVSAFWTHYYCFVQSTDEATLSPTIILEIKLMSTEHLLARYEFNTGRLVYFDICLQYPHISEPHEYTLLTNISALQSNLRQLYSQAIDNSHHGHPVVIENIHTGTHGRPAIHINEEFLRWAYWL